MKQTEMKSKERKKEVHQEKLESFLKPNSKEDILTEKYI